MTLFERRSDIAVGTPDQTADVKGYRRGTHRLVPPEETWNAVAPLLGTFGITRVADVTDLDDLGIPVHQAIRPTSASLSVSQGKGVTHELARVSAVMEMIEFEHAEHPPAPSARGPARQLDHVSYDLRGLQLTPGSLISDSVILDWIEARTVLSNSVVLVPRDYVLLSNAVRRVWAPPLFETTTNGLASGNSLSEATLHGLYELVERDCLSDVENVALDALTLVDQATVDDPDCRSMMERMTAGSNWLEIVDATNRFDLPCYLVYIWSESFPILMTGSGCHLDPAVALNRALTEAAQSRLTLISGTRDSVPEQVYLLSRGRRERPGHPGDAVPRADFSRRRNGAEATIGEDVAEVASRLSRQLAHEPFVVDLSRGHPGFAVAKTVAPGLRYRPGHRSIERMGMK